MTTDTRTRPTTAFTARAVLTFVVAAVALAVGIARLPVDAWMRGFLGSASSVVTSAFRLATCARDQQEGRDRLSRRRGTGARSVLCPAGRAGLAMTSGSSPSRATSGVQGSR